MSFGVIRDEGVPVSQRKIRVVGVVGGIGSGKSSVARWVAEHADVRVIDADKLGHEALLSPHVKQALRQHFGDGIFDSMGNVDRRALSQRVFGETPRHHAERRALEQIVHPEILKRMGSLITDAEQSGREAVLLDAAVLLEAGWKNRCHFVVFIDVPEAIREQRVFQRSGWSRDELRRREASQLSLSEKQKQSDFTISNVGDVSVAGNELLNFLRSR